MAPRDVAILRYKCNLKGTFNGKRLKPLYVTEVWASRGGKWVVVPYTETPVSRSAKKRHQAPARRLRHSGTSYGPAVSTRAMRTIAIVMILSGIAIGTGAALEFRYFGPATEQFWAGAIALPAGILFTIAGILLWMRGAASRTAVLRSAWVMAAATVVATVLRVMGPPATLIGLASAALALMWVRNSRRLSA